MNKVRLSALLLLGTILQVSAASAADYEPPPPVDELRPASYDWSGLYVGGWVGNVCFDDGSIDDGGVAGPQELDGCGYKGGAMLGYNHQIQDWVLGVEVDYGFSGSTIEKNYDADPTITGDTFDFNGIGTARAKFGYAFDDTLLFMTAGGAYADVTLNGRLGVGGATPFSTDESLFGWTVGLGMEHAVTDNFRLRLDYLYTEFSKKSFDCAPGCSPEVDPGSEHEVRLGAIWAFNWF